MATLTDLKMSLDLWANDRVRTGSFLRAVLANDLFDAVARADPESLELIGDVVKYIHCNLPSGCHGSRERVQEWEAHIPMNKKSGAMIDAEHDLRANERHQPLMGYEPMWKEQP